MDFTVEFVSRNLVAQSNFVGFRDGRNFMFFKASSVGVIHGVVPHGMTKDCHMAPWEKDTWHESHVVWRVPPRKCVHVTHGPWKR